MKKLLSLIALAGIFAACQPEEITTAFEDVNAVAAITVSAIDIASGNVVTSETEFTISNLPTGITFEKSGDVFFIEGNPTLNLTQPVSIKAKWKVGEPVTKTVEIDKVLAGGVANYNVIFLVGVKQVDPSTALYVDYEKSKEVSKKVEKFYLNNTHYASHTHDGGNWYLNPSEFILTGEVEYKSVNSSKVLKVEVAAPEYANGVATIGAYVKSNDFYKEEDCKLPIQVSAFAMYTAWQETCTLVTEYEIIAELDGAKKIKAGTITFETISYYKAQYEEMPCPGHESHYVHGHGHDGHGHGGYNNAGGGIVVGE